MAIIEHVQVKTGDSVKTLKEMRKELRDLRDQLVNTQKGTEEYNQTVQKAANIQHELREQMQEINASAMDLGQKLGNATKAMTGISGAITAATGALSLFGIENEEAQKRIQTTMTALIGITQGLSKMDDGVKAFKRLTLAINTGSGALGKFKMALIATGLGALVVVLGSIIAYWDDFTAAIGVSEEKMQKFGDVAKGVLNVITSSLKGLVQALGKMLKGDFSGAWDALKNGFNVVDNFNQGVADSVAKREEEQTKKAKEEADKRAKIAEDEYKKRIEAAKKLADYEKDMAMSQLRGKDADKYSAKSVEIQGKYFDTLLKIYKKDSDEYKNTILQKEQWLQDLENHQIDAANAEDERARKQAERESEERKRLLGGFNDSLLSEQEQLDARYQMLIDAATKEGEDTTAIEKWYADEKTRIAKEQADEAERIAKENADKEAAIQKAKLNAYFSVASGIGDILGSMSDMMEEGSKEQKGMATAAATIQMLVGIATAISGAFTTKTGPWDIALAAVQAASIAASGIASIVKINQVKTDGSNAGASSVPSINMGSVMGSMPDFTQTVDGAMTEAAIKDQKVYVTEHDITETQTKVRVQQAQATY